MDKINTRDETNEIDKKKLSSASSSSSVSSNIELKSPTVQEILGRPPRWIIRWGITVILAVIILLFIGCFFFKYPQVVAAPIEVTTENLPVSLVAKTSGKIDTLFVEDKQSVEQGELLAVIENPADYADVIRLEAFIKNLNFYDNQQDAFDSQVVKDFMTDNKLQLGELQTPFYQFEKALKDYQYFISANIHEKKIAVLHKQINMQKQLLQSSNRQCAISRQQLSAQQRLFAIDSTLYAKNALSAVAYENAKNTLLQMQQSCENTNNTLNNIQINIIQTEQTILDLQQQKDEQEKQLFLTLSGASDQLQAQINQWTQQYLFVSPMAGKVSLTQFWQKNQFVNAGSQVVNIVPEGKARIIGKVMLPGMSSGKVKVGQAVNVKFDAFPYMEFGMVRAVVNNISLVPMSNESGKFVVVEIGFPNNLLTNYKKRLDFSQQMSGTAEIITEDMRLIERFLNPIKALIKR